MTLKVDSKNYNPESLDENIRKGLVITNASYFLYEGKTAANNESLFRKANFCSGGVAESSVSDW